jgi:arylsulfatase A-like enzyme
MIAFTSDHGEEFDDHGSMEGHAWTLYDEVIRVPLTLIFPAGENKGRTVGQMVQLIDLAPTILDFVGLDPPGQFEGRSLVPLLNKDESERWEEFAFSHIRRINLKWSLRTPDYKLIYTGDTKVNRLGVPVRAGFEMYDLENDPAEQYDIFDSESQISRTLVNRLDSLIARRGPAQEVNEPRLSEEELERLRSLGYVE